MKSKIYMASIIDQYMANIININVYGFEFIYRVYI